ncbi:translation initiation factor IF-2 subunit beta [Candidatus Micrarchaeota archaeon]|nr:translation initiation factor IF-2 subunit beta [Candidatus Micrarchaeota archaeon]
MVLENYEELLDKGYKSLPEKVLRHERFEIPLVESFNQGSKTILKNFDFISQTLRRKPEEIVKYLTKELAVPISIEGQRLILQSKFNERILNEKIKSYCETFVICKECKKPDTKLQELERGRRMLVCEACGARAPVRG